MLSVSHEKNLLTSSGCLCVCRIRGYRVEDLCDERSFEASRPNGRRVRTIRQIERAQWPKRTIMGFPGWRAVVRSTAFFSDSASESEGSSNPSLACPKDLEAEAILEFERETNPERETNQDRERNPKSKGAARQTEVIAKSDSCSASSSNSWPRSRSSAIRDCPVIHFGVRCFGRRGDTDMGHDNKGQGGAKCKTLKPLMPIQASDDNCCAAGAKASS
jgi:hypothetical protein